jgi:hypothetical protein
VPLRGSLHERAPKVLVHYARGLAMSVVHNVPAYGFSIVAGSAAVATTAELRDPTALDAFLFLIGAACAFALIGIVAAVAFEAERIDEASAPAIFIGSILSLVSTSAGFGAALLVVRYLRGWDAWFLSAFCATTAYVIVLALEMELATLVHGPKRDER